MALYIVRKANPYYPTGTWVECFEQGCQKAVVKTVNNRLEVVDNEGILLPLQQLKPFLMKPAKWGLDK